MKKLSTMLLSGLTTTLLLTGCGGGGGGSTTTTTTTSTKATYTGAATAGDFANYSVESDGTNFKIKYSVKGKVFGDKSGEIDVQNMYENVFFKDAYNDYYFISGSLGMAKVKFDTATAYVVGLNIPQTAITADVLSNVVNKTYNIADLDSDTGAFSLKLLDVNTTDVNSLSGTWTLHEVTGDISGTWKVNNNYIEFYNSNNELEANVVLKPGESRSGIIIDKVDGGFAIGLEAKPITETEIGTSTFYYFDQTSSYSCFGKVDVNGVNFTYSDTWCEDGARDIDVSGTLKLNPQIDPDNDPSTDNNVTLNGLAKVDGANIYIFYDAKDGYYIKINLDQYEFSLGSNKPLQ